MESIKDAKESYISCVYICVCVCTMLRGLICQGVHYFSSHSRDNICGHDFELLRQVKCHQFIPGVNLE